MRNIFFEDEIDYFRETAISILYDFIKNQYCIASSSVLIQLKHEIENGLSIEKIIQKIDFRNICDTIRERDKNNMIESECSDQVIKEELQKLDCALESPQLKEVIATLNNLLHAVQNKFVYLEEHQDELTQIEKDESLQCDWFGSSRLLLAMERGDLNRALNFIDRGMFINQRNNCGKTPLMLAAKMGNDTLIHALLAKGANLNESTRSDKPFETALYFAIKEKQQATARLLISAGAKVNFEFTKYLGNKPEMFSLTDLAKKCGIDLNITPSLKFEM